MQAVTLRRHGPPRSLRVERCAEPSVGAHDVLVQVKAAGVNFADVLARTVLSPQELPIGVVTAFFGAPFFAVVLRTTRRTA